MFQRYKILHIPTGLYVYYVYRTKANKYVYSLSEHYQIFDSYNLDRYYTCMSVVWWDITGESEGGQQQGYKNEFVVMEI